MKKYGILVVFLSLALILSACAPKNPLLGKWESESGEDVITFYEDGTIVIVSGTVRLPGTYEIIDKSNLKIEFDGYFNLMDPTITDYKISGKTLTLGMLGDDFVLTKVK